jgi:phosphoglycolate phosphatase-like HAD superfamily hydrolase
MVAPLQIETLNDASASAARVAIFDFDGTLSLLRSGWSGVMEAMMLAELTRTGSGESVETLRAIVRDYIERLTGKPTIYQMIEFARQLELRGVNAEDPTVYFSRFTSLLEPVIERRMREVRDGAGPEKHLVPGTFRLLDSLLERGMRMYIASGTVHEAVLDEAAVLGLTPYFEDRIYGARAEGGSPKRDLIERIVSSGVCEGSEILGFGDGTDETEHVKAAGGVAVGVASDEPICEAIDLRKRARLIGAGADYIIPNFLCFDELRRSLFAC